MHDLELEPIGTSEVERVVAARPERELGGAVEDLGAQLAHEPMQRTEPDCSAGFKRFEASMAPPDVAPAPMTVWISSMNRTAPG